MHVALVTAAPQAGVLDPSELTLETLRAFDRETDIFFPRQRAKGGTSVQRVLRKSERFPEHSATMTMNLPSPARDERLVCASARRCCRSTAPAWLRRSSSLLLTLVIACR